MYIVDRHEFDFFSLKDSKEVDGPTFLALLQ